LQDGDAGADVAEGDDNVDRACSESLTDRFDARTAEKVARARTNVPTAVANDAIVAQSVIADSNYRAGSTKRLPVPWRTSGGTEKVVPFARSSRGARGDGESERTAKRGTYRRENGGRSPV